MNKLGFIPVSRLHKLSSDVTDLIERIDNEEERSAVTKDIAHAISVGIKNEKKVPVKNHHVGLKGQTGLRDALTDQQFSDKYKDITPDESYNALADIPVVLPKSKKIIQFVLEKRKLPTGPIRVDKRKAREYPLPKPGDLPTPPPRSIEDRAIADLDWKAKQEYKEFLQKARSDSNRVDDMLIQAGLIEPQSNYDRRKLAIYIRTSNLLKLAKQCQQHIKTS